MEKLTFSTTINASRQQVWDVLWGDVTYSEWTAAFCEGSHAITDWQKGSKVLFLDPKKNGMVSTVAERIEPEYMSFEHLGEVKNGVEDTESDAVKIWAGAHENYTLTNVNGQTKLVVDLESGGIPDEFKDYFVITWPIALDKLKEITERQ
ncbi:SRPBCC domain-containing protein [Mucilaginibacter terrae]|uniref:Uncharacterized protein YndB with AHSA1/START domain n=1 Tax=Mucilaginibacter terrae TaxID=1955052 RepID=A0ABU3GXM8_9SPHI|nr:SRPBCC domain-containing protein [Mucilaginibacter terrae]MDT3403430.1 uncharacterized protein YndB with AHSA1/START domain [Mucilaginibacter terrae]